MTYWKRPQSLHKAGLGLMFVLCLHHTCAWMAFRPYFGTFTHRVLREYYKTEGDVELVSSLSIYPLSYYPLICG